MIRLLAASLVTVWALASAIGAQTPDPAYAFETASVKPNQSASGDSGLSPNRGSGFVVENMTLARLIMAAYQVQRFQLEGGPAWMHSARFDIVARYRVDTPPLAAGGPTRWMLALRALFADRFKLAVHPETRPLPVFAMVVARDDRRLGPALRPAATDCAARAAADAAAIKAGGPPPPPVNTEARMACGIRNTGTRILFGGNPLSLLAQGLSNQLQRPVLDRTGLAGNWDFELTFTPERDAAAAAGDQAPSIFTAVQEQLGLRLDAATAPVQVMVIDRVERPTAD